MNDPLLGTLGWPFQASQSAYGFDEKSTALVPLHPVPTSEDIYEFLKLYCSPELLLVVSPYTSLFHLLDLNSLKTPQQLMAKALILMSSLRSDYALAPYAEAFNWPIVINALRALVKEQGISWQRQEFYIIIFRSTLAPTTNYMKLGEMDEKAHIEATKSGGLLKYWFGEPDAEGNNLATCVWRNHEDTKGGSSGDGHQTAMRATRNVFSKWVVERKIFVVDDNVDQWWFEDFTL